MYPESNLTKDFGSHHSLHNAHALVKIGPFYPWGKIGVKRVHKVLKQGKMLGGVKSEGLG